MRVCGFVNLRRGKFEESGEERDVLNEVRLTWQISGTGNSISLFTLQQQQT